MNIESREVTYRSAVEQIFFEDGTELCITIGAPATGGGGFDIEFDWVDGKPDWAEYLDEKTLVNYEAM
jgi:hypothetical protein